MFNGFKLIFRNESAPVWTNFGICGLNFGVLSSTHHISRVCPSEWTWEIKGLLEESKNMCIIIIIIIIILIIIILLLLLLCFVSI